MVQSGASNEFPEPMRGKLLACGYRSLPDLSSHTLEQFLSTCPLSLPELALLRERMGRKGISFRPDAIRYPFISPRLQEQLRSAGIDISQTSLTTIGLPAWAETPLIEGGIRTVQELVGSSTFYVRAALGYGGRPQNIVRQRVEEYLVLLLRSIHQASGEIGPPASKSLESLGLGPRTLNALRRGGIYTVEQVQRMDEAELAHLRGLGPKGLAEITQLVPSPGVTATPKPDVAVQAEVMSVRPGVARRPVSDLDLPETLTRRLQSAGIATIGDMLAGSGDSLRSIPRIGRVSEGRIRSALETLLLDTLADVGDVVPAIVAEVQVGAAATSFDERMRGLIRSSGSERAIQLLERRFGLGGRVWTLEAAGSELGVSRERARQLEQAALNKLKREHPAELHCLARPAYEALAEVGGVAPMTYMLEQLPSLYKLERIHVLGAARFLMETASDCERLPGGLCRLADAPPSDVAAIDEAMVTLLRKRMEPLPVKEITAAIAESTPYAAVLQRFASFSLAARARANPHMCVLPNGNLVLKEWSRNKLDNAIRALRALGSPSHYRQIARQVALDPTQETAVTEETLHNLLLGEAAFVRLGRGVFGLAEWQESGPELAQQLEEQLAQADRPLHKSELARLLGADERGVERSLMTDSRFSPSGHGYYRLAGKEYPAKTEAESAGAEEDRRRRSASVREISYGPRGQFARIHVSPAMRRSGALALNAALLSLFPDQGELPAAWPASEQNSGRQYRLRRGRSHVSGLSRFLHSHNVMAGESIYIERTGDPKLVYNLYTEAQWRTTVMSKQDSEDSGVSSDS